MSNDAKALPLTTDALRALLEELGVNEAPFFDEAGNFTFNPDDGWPGRWTFENRLQDWREISDPRYEGLEDAALVPAELAAGRLPGHVTDESELVEELWKDGGGNVFFRLDGVRTVDGHAPVFFFDHDMRYVVTACARNLVELYARHAIEEWLSWKERKPWQESLESPIALDAESLSKFGECFADGWRTAIGLSARGEVPKRRKPEHDRVEGEALDGLDNLREFSEAYASRYILARAVDEAAFLEAIRPLSWWGDRFDDLDASMRNVMARFLSLVSQPAPEGDDLKPKLKYKRMRDTGLAAAQFLDGLYQRGEMRLGVKADPLELIDAGNTAALDWMGHESFPFELPEDDGVRLLDTVPPMSEFHGGWAGIVPGEVLAQGDHLAFATHKDLCSKLRVNCHTALSIIAKSGDEHIEPLTAAMPGFIPVDQLRICRVLTRFSKHPGVIALMDALIESTAHDHVREEVATLREKVATGSRR